uniref:Uncharacterized protein n=1 Tax=Cacopsylla melanoneura TaxID=428564 RepID=A0A8D8SP25_9HEMI
MNQKMTQLDPVLTITWILYVKVCQNLHQSFMSFYFKFVPSSIYLGINWIKYKFNFVRLSLSFKKSSEIHKNHCTIVLKLVLENIIFCSKLEVSFQRTPPPKIS